MTKAASPPHASAASKQNPPPKQAPESVDQPDEIGMTEDQHYQLY
ncbi:hypothetical protein [Glaciimonas sp. GG7]